MSQADITAAHQAAIVRAAAITPDLARLLGLAPNDGVVIGTRMKADIPGDRIQIDGVDAHVSAVAPDWLEGLYRDRAIDVWTPLQDAALQGFDRNTRNSFLPTRRALIVNPILILRDDN